MKQVPGGRYRDGIWTCPVSWASVRIVRGIFGDDLKVDDTVAQWLWHEYENRVQVAMADRGKAMDPSLEVQYSHVQGLYPYQGTGSRFLTSAQSSGLFDDPGTGKTVQAIETLEELDAYPALIVCPKTAKPTWRREFSRWAPHRDVVAVDGGAGQRRKLLEEEHDVYIVSWDGLRIHSRLASYGSVRLSDEEKKPKELNRHWAAVVADEAHRAISPKAKQTRALWAVGATADHRFPLTGTPINDSPADFWSLLHFISPEEWPSRSKYIDRYCAVSTNMWGSIDIYGLKPSTEAEFHQLTETRFLRRPKALVLPWLPDKTYETWDVEMLPAQARAYKQFEKDMVADLESGTGLALDNLSLSTRLVQLASATLDVTEDGGLRMTKPSSKIDALMDLLEDMNDEPLVVFAASRQLIELASTALSEKDISHSMIVGGQSELAREGAELDFMAGRVRAILMTFGAGSESITLTRADTICRLQRSWSFRENKQSEDRIHRPGLDSNKALIIDFVAPGTVESEQQLAALDEKAARMEEIVRDRRALLKLS